MRHERPVVGKSLESFAFPHGKSSHSTYGPAGPHWNHMSRRDSLVVNAGCPVSFRRPAGLQSPDNHRFRLIVLSTHAASVQAVGPVSCGSCDYVRVRICRSRQRCRLVAFVVNETVSGCSVRRSHQSIFTRTTIAVRTRCDWRCHQRRPSPRSVFRCVEPFRPKRTSYQMSCLSLVVVCTACSNACCSEGGNVRFLLAASLRIH